MRFLNKSERLIESLRGLIADAKTSSQASARLNAIEVILFSSEVLSLSHLNRIAEKGKYKLTIKHALRVYAMMAGVAVLCEPCGSKVGPACSVTVIDFEKLTLAKAFDLRGSAAMRLLFRIEEFSKPRRFSGLDLLDEKEKQLYELVRAYCGNRRRRPTLLSVASEMVRQETEDAIAANGNQSRITFSERSVLRYVEELKHYQFKDLDWRRDNMIRFVDRYGSDRQSLRQLASTVMLPQSF